MFWKCFVNTELKAYVWRQMSVFLLALACISRAENDDVKSRTNLYVFSNAIGRIVPVDPTPQVTWLTFPGVRLHEALRGLVGIYNIIAPREWLESRDFDLLSRYFDDIVRSVCAAPHRKTQHFDWIIIILQQKYNYLWLLNVNSTGIL